MTSVKPYVMENQPSEKEYRFDDHSSQALSNEEDPLFFLSTLHIATPGAKHSNLS